MSIYLSSIKKGPLAALAIDRMIKCLNCGRARSGGASYPSWGNLVPPYPTKII